MYVRLRSLRFITRMSCGGADSRLRRGLFSYLPFLLGYPAGTSAEPGEPQVEARYTSWYIGCYLMQTIIPSHWDQVNIYLNTFSIILGHHTARIILMSCGISKGSNHRLRKTCEFQRALTIDFERQWFVAFFSVGMQWLWFLTKLVCVTVFQTFHFCCL